MGNNGYEIDQEMLGDFIDESLEALSVIPGLFVAFEANPTDLDLVEAVFRPIHSLKGNAAYFGLMWVKSLAHDMESILDLLRKEMLLPDREIIDGLLAGVDEIYDILDKTRAHGKEVIDTERFEKVHSLVQSLLTIDRAPVKDPHSQDNQWSQIIQALHELESMPEIKGSPASRKLQEVEEMFWKMCPPELLTDHQPSKKKDLASAADDSNPFEQLESILTHSPEGMTLDDEAALALDLLIRIKRLAESEQATKILDNCLEEYDLFVSRIGYDTMLKESLLEALETLASLQQWKADKAVGASPIAETPAESEPEKVPEKHKSEPVVAAAEPASKDKESRGRDKESRTMRISEERVDVFLSYVGELIAVDEMLRYIHSEMVRRTSDMQISTSLLRIVNTFTKLSDDLQNSIMEIRKVSVRPMLQKTQRIVRDIASSCNKTIEAYLEGEDVTIDRSLVDTLEAPMVHMIRNAADHGIESPEDRRAAGKPERGTIRVSMNETEESIVLTISDDGRGLNYKGIQAKAVKLGILKKGVPVSEETLKEMIFAPGFSTAEEVTDVSGRGVGMDAVKRSVEDAGGRVELKSETGKGTEFLISLPKSVGTQILHSFVVQIGEERFVLPMDKISGSFRSEGHFNRLPNGNVCVKRNDIIFPVVCLDGPYVGPIEPLSSGILVTIDNRGNPFVFFVDAILGMQKVVLRTIPWIHPEKFLGAAIMGDGRVSMIVNVDTLCLRVQESKTA